MSGDERISLTRDQLKDIVAEGVHETLTSLGIDADEVHEMQRDFIFLRELRKTHERVKSKGVLTLVAIVVGGFVTLTVMGLKSWIFGG